jgi:chromosome partitioning protein
MIIAITNQKGGVGKTTTAVNLSSAMVKLKKKVLLIDIDAQGNACSGLGLNKEEENVGIYEILIEDFDIKKTIIKTDYGVDLIPVNSHLAGANVQLLQKPNREKRLKDALDLIKDDYDYIFIDCPPSLDIMTLNGLVAAQAVIIPLQCEYYALEGLAQLLKTISLVQKKLNPILKIEGVLLTMFDPRTNLSNQVMEEAKSYFNEKVYQTIIPRNVKLSEAPSYGQPIDFYDASSVGAKSYANLAKEILHKG